MRKLFQLGVMLLVALGLRAQAPPPNVTVTATAITDPNGQAYANGYYTVDFQQGQTFNIVPGANTLTKTGRMDGTGSINPGISLAVTDQIGGGSRWRFQICSASGQTCFGQYLNIHQTTTDVGGQLTAVAKKILGVDIVNAGPRFDTNLSTPIVSLPGNPNNVETNQLFCASTPTAYVWDVYNAGGTSVCALDCMGVFHGACSVGGGGGLTNFSAGNLPPLFTTTVTNPTTTPNLAFNLSNAAGGTVFGNNTGASGAPAYTSTPVLGIPNSVQGTLGFAGVTSGTVTVRAQNTAGTWTLQLPQNAGTNGFCLLTDGTGITSWQSCPGGVTAITRRIYLFTAGCANPTGNVASSAFDLSAANAFVANCKVDGTNGTVQGVLNAAKSSIGFQTVPLPSDFQSLKDFQIWFTVNDTTQNNTVIFQVAPTAVAPNTNVTDTPAYAAFQNFPTVTIGAGAVANALYSATLSNPTCNGCAAGSVLHIQFKRSAADTSSDTGVAISAGAILMEYNGLLTP